MNREIMQQALHHLVDLADDLRRIPSDIAQTIAALETELAKPEQEPVAWAVLRPDGRVKLLSHQQGVEVDLKWTPLYVAPTKREWVGLTNEEVQEIAKQLIDDAAYCSTHFAIAIEAELRRKNNAV